MSRGDRKHLREYAESHDRCAVCWWRAGRYGRRMEVHHLVGRYGKTPHDPRGLLLVCEECHRAFHQGGKKSLDLCAMLAIKKEEDGDLDLPYLAGLRGRKAYPCPDEPAELPDWVAMERQSNAL